MKKTLVALAATVPLLLSSTALAAPPLEPIPPQPPLTGLQLCGTTITIEEVVQREKVNTKTGRVTGALKVRVTNEETGESVLVNASGPGTFAETVDEEAGTVTFSFDFRGRSLVFPFDPEERAFFEQAGLPDIFTTSGPLSGTVVLDISEADEDTPPTVESVEIDTPRRVVDICEALT